MRLNPQVPDDEAGSTDSGVRNGGRRGLGGGWRRRGEGGRSVGLEGRQAYRQMAENSVSIPKNSAFQ